MKMRIERFPVRQNAKVIAVIMAVNALVFAIPMFLVVSLSAPKSAGFPGMVFILLMPLMYLAFGYVLAAIGCWVYNLLARFTGGLEFESRNVEG
jgi:hypothetical protein